MIAEGLALALQTNGIIGIRGTMNDKILLTVLMLFLIALLPAPVAVADHDDGDDVEFYDYVLHFNQQDLSGFVAFIMEDESFEIYGEYLYIGKTVGAKREAELDPEGKHPYDLTLLYSGDIPKVLWGIPNAEVSQEIARWIDAHHDMLEPFQAFKEAFGKRVTPMRYRRSPVLVKVLELAKCGMHFLKPRGAALNQIIEDVAIETSSSEIRIVPVGYRFEYIGSPVVEITADHAQVMTKADFDKLLNIGQAESVLWPSSIRRFHHTWVWFFGAPAIGTVGLLALYVRTRRHGK